MEASKQNRLHRVKSLIWNAIHSLRRPKRVSIITIVTLCILTIFAFMLVHMQMGYAIYINGEVVGAVKSREEISQVIERTERQLEEI